MFQAPSILRARRSPTRGHRFEAQRPRLPGNAVAFVPEAILPNALKLRWKLDAASFANASDRGRVDTEADVTWSGSRWVGLAILARQRDARWHATGIYDQMVSGANAGAVNW